MHRSARWKGKSLIWRGKKKNPIELADKIQLGIYKIRRLSKWFLYYRNYYIATFSFLSSLWYCHLSPLRCANTSAVERGFHFIDGIFGRLTKKKTAITLFPSIPFVRNFGAAKKYFKFGICFMTAAITMIHTHTHVEWRQMENNSEDSAKSEQFLSHNAQSKMNIL